MDLDGDGHQDILSGSWPGELFLFRGRPDGTPRQPDLSDLYEQAQSLLRGRPDGNFTAPEMIRDKEGEIINIGGGIEEQPGGRILIRGNAEFERTPEGTFVNYHGKRLKSTPEKPIAITGTASAAHAADWDGDGDFDLLVGDIRGKLHLVPNEGTAEDYAFGKGRRLKADGAPIRVEGDAGPFVADWDGDGDLDLLSGAGDGSVSLYRNVGSRTEPALAAAEQLVPPGEVAYGSDAPAEPRRGIRSKVCAADWNGDGRLDLLVGDFATQKPDRPEPTPEERAEQEKIRKELESVRKRFSKLFGKLRGPDRVRDEEKHQKLREELQALSDKRQSLRSKLPQEYERHGWVWLFLRKSAD